MDGAKTEGGVSKGVAGSAQSGQGAAELVLRVPILGEMQGGAAGLRGDASGQGEEAASQGRGGCCRVAQPDARGPAGQVMGDGPVLDTGSRMAFSVTA